MNEKLMFSGINSDYYEYEDGKVIKLFKKGQKAEFVLDEYNKAIEVASKTMLAPTPIQMDKYLGREGIVYSMVTGNSALDLAINAKDPIYCANVLTDALNKITSVTGLKFKNYKEGLKASILKAYDAHEINGDAKECAFEILKKLPDGTSLCNAMIEPNNIIINKGIEIIPEWDKVCIGTKEYELARIYTHLMIRSYPEKGYNEKSIKEFLQYVYQAMVKSTNIAIEDVKDYVYVICAAMLGEYVEYGSDVALKEFIRNGEF